MDPKLEQLIARTNVGDLIKPASSEVDLRQPVETVAPPKIEVARSTVDPFQANFAVADVVGKLQDAPTGGGLRSFALVFLGGPMMIFGVLIMALAWTNPRLGVAGLMVATVMGVAMAGFWPFFILSKRRAQHRPATGHRVADADASDPYRAPSYVAPVQASNERNALQMLLSVSVGVFCVLQFVGIAVAASGLVMEWGMRDAPWLYLAGKMALPATLLLGGLLLLAGRRLATFFFAAYLVQYLVESGLRRDFGDLATVWLGILFLACSAWLWMQGKLQGWPWDRTRAAPHRA